MTWGGWIAAALSASFPLLANGGGGGAGVAFCADERPLKKPTQLDAMTGRMTREFMRR
jgi:hypothetical protein